MMGLRFGPPQMSNNADRCHQFLAPELKALRCRVTADEGDIGRGHRQRFQGVETRTPVILTTGLAAPTCSNVVLVL